MNRRTVLAIPTVLAAQLLAQPDRSNKKLGSAGWKPPAEAERANAKRVVETARVNSKTLTPQEQALYERQLLGLMILCFDKTNLATVYSTDYAHQSQELALVESLLLR